MKFLLLALITLSISCSKQNTSSESQAKKTIEDEISIDLAPATLQVGGTTVTIDEDPMDFLSIPIGQSSTKSIIVSNTVAAVTNLVKDFSQKGPFLITDACTTSLASRKKCTITIKYTATEQEQSNGVSNGSIMINGKVIELIAQSGSAVTPPISELLSITPNPLNLGQDVSGKLSGAIQIKNNTASAKTMNINLGTHPELTMSHNCGASLAGRKGCAISVAYAKINETAISHSISIDGVVVPVLIEKTLPSTEPSNNAKVTVTPSSYDFGVAPVGKLLKHRLAIKNTGIANESLDVILDSVAPFSVVSGLSSCGAEIIARKTCYIYLEHTMGSSAVSSSVSVEGSIATFSASIQASASSCSMDNALANGILSLTGVSSIAGDLPNCYIDNCLSNYTTTLDLKSCVLSQMSCAPGELPTGATAGNKTWNGSAYSACQITSCNSPSYSLVGNACQPNSTECTLANAAANGVTINQVASVSGDTPACLVSSCNIGYLISGDAKSCIAKSCASVNSQEISSMGISVSNSSGVLAGTAYPNCTLASNACNSGYILAGNSKSCTSTIVNYKTMFGANDGGIFGRELWMTDGTVAGTNMVADINPGEVLVSSNPDDLLYANNRLFFKASDPNIGPVFRVTDFVSESMMFASVNINRMEQNIVSIPSNYLGTSKNPYAVDSGIFYFIEDNSLLKADLYFSDGTIPGTVLVKSGFDTEFSSNSFGAIGSIGNRMFFVAKEKNVSTYGFELWVTDGTNAGTYMVKDIRQGSEGFKSEGSYYPSYSAILNNKLYFVADDGVNEQEIWVTDGTEAGTHILKILRTGFNPNFSEIVVANNKMYFQASTDDGGKFMESDGTEAGTIPFMNSLSISYLRSINNKLYFNSAAGGNGRELWVSDGTSVGTRMIKNIHPGTDISSNIIHNVYGVGNKIVFWANDGVNGSELWVSDDTEAGTFLLKDIVAGPSNSTFSKGVQLGNKFLFWTTTSAEGTELWSTDGTVLGTQMVKDINPGASSSFRNGVNVAVVDNKMYFSANNGVETELWETDGTEAGTVIFENNGEYADSSNPSAFAVLNNKIYFSGRDQVVGQELRVTDGTSNGTQLVKDINPGSVNSSPSSLISIENKIIFTANNINSGTELWATDGTEAGTLLIKDINPGINSASISGMVLFGNKVLFSANNGTNGNELWISDGTESGTYMVKDINPGSGASSPSTITVTNNKAYFRANNGTNGLELWVTDGTEAGTVMVKDINPGTTGGFGGILLALNGNVYLSANDGINGIELWFSNGTEAGTYMVKDINPGTASSSANSLVAFNNKIYFGATTVLNGLELWATDGTEAGTVMVKDILPGTGNGFGSNTLRVLNNKLSFRASDGVNGFELWETDGTEAGTVMVKDILPGSASGYASTNAMPFNGNKILQVFSDIDHGAELWITDGTSLGTYLLKDIYPGSTNSNISSFVNLGSKVLFLANDGINGTELWVTDGTEAGTILLEDINPGIGNSSASGFILYNF